MVGDGEWMGGWVDGWMGGWVFFAGFSDGINLLNVLLSQFLL
jgi:hypothetical protein